MEYIQSISEIYKINISWKTCNNKPGYYRFTGERLAVKKIEILIDEIAK
jgi:hypothetical protein